MITQADLDNWFMYHAPKPGQQERYIALRSAAKALAQVVVALVPPGPDQTVAIRKIREAVMTANQAIACEDDHTAQIMDLNAKQSGSTS